MNAILKLSAALALALTMTACEVAEDVEDNGVGDNGVIEGEEADE